MAATSRNSNWYGSGGEILTETNPNALEIVDYVYFNGKRVAQLANDFNLNGGFESGLQGWSLSGTATAQVMTNAANAHSGSNYVEISAPADNSYSQLSSTHSLFRPRRAKPSPPLPGPIMKQTLAPTRGSS